ncbi:hypothetical protein H7J51_23750 [Mycobacterium crocinum]|nr:hypothetical protein [Mycolicibacterium crocinum]
MGAPHRCPGPHHDHEDDDHNDDDGDDDPDGDDDSDHVTHVTHVTDVHDVAEPGAVSDPWAAHSDPVTCAGPHPGTGPGAHGDARGADAVAGPAAVDGYTGVP